MTALLKRMFGFFCLGGLVPVIDPLNAPASGVPSENIWPGLQRRMRGRNANALALLGVFLSEQWRWTTSALPGA